MTVDGRYLLDRPVEGYGLGEAFRAVDTAAGRRRVCVKVLPTASADTAQGFLAHGESLRNLQHPNVLPWTAWGVALGRPYVVTDLSEAESLTAWIERLQANRARPDPQVVWRIVEQVCLGVRAAHTGIGAGPMIHGGITPGAIRVERRGAEDYEVSVLDFGLLPFAGAMGSRPWEYIAPEQEGAPEVIPATDVFGIGVLLVDCLMARPSSRSDVAPAWWQVVRARDADVHGLLAQLRSDVHPSVWEALTPALRRLPEQRYPTAGRLRDALRKATWVAVTAADPPPALVRPRLRPPTLTVPVSPPPVIPAPRTPAATPPPPPSLSVIPVMPVIPMIPVIPPVASAVLSTVPVTASDYDDEESTALMSMAHFAPQFRAMTPQPVPSRPPADDESENDTASFDRPQVSQDDHEHTMVLDEARVAHAIGPQALSPPVVSPVLPTGHRPLRAPTIPSTGPSAFRPAPAVPVASPPPSPGSAWDPLHNAHPVALPWPATPQAIPPAPTPAPARARPPQPPRTHGMPMAVGRQDHFAGFPDAAPQPWAPGTPGPAVSVQAPSRAVALVLGVAVFILLALGVASGLYLATR